MKAFVGAMVLLVAGAEPVLSQNEIVGEYLCTISARAGIASFHFEDADPPEAFVDNELPSRFRMRITGDTDGAQQYRAFEIEYDGEDRVPQQWHTNNSILHSTYLGDGALFHATEDPAFFTLQRTMHSNRDGSLSFYHTGFEYMGGEDTHLSVRWGRCRKTN
ncbi:hypothetical protein HFP51_02895 [Parasphingopyxis sp. CP4]|uniref:hypothetical protein n=1 Tax=Parasphingopyxis sp. CP4 TaxID=2724527 RepID=UPI0015A01D15|nr:hypothetical protein [Parasphingopyxis sp. CP4]QLC21225.1 hypothetical protein HFP51_02895 [Parasphingopyxis sp. CP4]